MLSVFGGKITTFRKLSEHLVDKLQPYFEFMNSAWTQSAVLPGGDIPAADYQAYLLTIHQQYPWLDSRTIEHLTQSYGTLMHQVIGNAESITEMGQQFASTFYECEARYLIEHEWAQSAEDVLTRRTKHGLHMTQVEKEIFVQWWQTNVENGGSKSQSNRVLEESVNEL